VLAAVPFFNHRSGRRKVAQQSVHPTLGILAQFQAFFYASAFFQLDGVPPPAPARVTQTVRPLPSKIEFQNLSAIGVKSIQTV